MSDPSDKKVRAFRHVPVEPDQHCISELELLLARARTGEVVGVAAAVEVVGAFWEQRYMGTARRQSVREFCSWLDEMHFDLRVWIKQHERE